MLVSPSMSSLLPHSEHLYWFVDGVSTALQVLTDMAVSLVSIRPVHGPKQRQKRLDLEVTFNI